MIISTDMRTDIPVFYAKWLNNRLKDGYVYVRNPYYKLCAVDFKVNLKSTN